MKLKWKILKLLDDVFIIDDFVKAYIDLKACFAYQNSENESGYLCHICGCEYLIYDMLFDIHSFVTLVEHYKDVEK